MRASRVALALALSLVTGGVVAGAAAADDPRVPSQQDVRDARTAVRDTAGTVAEVRARLVVANQELERSSIAAAQASEAYNGARWKAAQARQVARAAQQRSRIAAADVDRQRAAYGDTLVSSYEMSPALTALAGIARSNGIGTVIERTTSLQNAERAMDSTYDRFRASATLADVATQQANDAQDAAVAAQEDARTAKVAAQAAADRAASQASAIAAEKSTLIERLAQLQHVSVQLAQQRQAALEQRAAAAAAAAAQAQAQHQAQHQAAVQAAQQVQHQAQQAQAQQAHQTQHPQAAAHPQQGSSPNPNPNPTPDPPGPSPTPDPPAPSTPAPPATPAPASGASAAIAFARAQLGEPYVWGAAGPNAWDCSGLTMGAWRAGGKYLPHYSVAQYEQSTPISAGQLRPGDLVFWGTSSSPSSIYHVALYIGGGMIIQAPRTGRPVSVDSMYYWIPPNFYARP